MVNLSHFYYRFNKKNIPIRKLKLYSLFILLAIITYLWIYFDPLERLRRSEYERSVVLNSSIYIEKQYMSMMSTHLIRANSKKCTQWVVITTVKTQRSTSVTYEMRFTRGA